MIEIKDKSKCTGCNACSNACPKQCIKMTSDDEGFAYPKVDRKKCVDCGLCEKICPVLTDKAQALFQEAYAAYANDESIRMSSSSGGVFSVLAEYILDNGGVVFGAAFNDDMQVKHICVDNKSNLYKLRMSKYVQSYIGDTYIQAKRILNSGRLVLFTGTPCQIAGLKKYLGNDYDNLYTQDIVCHGVPSPLVWKQYVNYKASILKRDITRVQFRSKVFGWKNFSIQFGFSDNKTEVYSQNEDLYFKAFLDNLILRPSCYNCSFKGKNLASDITLADFWGIEEILPDMDDNRGTSLVICNTPKGKTLFQKIQSGLMLSTVDYNQAIHENSAAIRSVRRPGSRNIIFKYLNHHQINKTLGMFTHEDEASKKKVQILEDYEEVKKEKGPFFAKLWYLKNR